MTGHNPDEPGCPLHDPCLYFPEQPHTAGMTHCGTTACTCDEVAAERIEQVVDAWLLNYQTQGQIDEWKADSNAQKRFRYANLTDFVKFVQENPS